MEERSRRSFGVTGFLISGGGAGAVSCWLTIGNLYPDKAPHLVLNLLLAGPATFILAIVVAYAAALAGYKTFDTAALLPTDALSRPDNSADRWMVLTGIARLVSALLIAAGGLLTFLAYLKLVG